MKPSNFIREQHWNSSSSSALEIQTYPRITLRLKFLLAIFLVHLSIFGFLIIYFIADLKVSTIEREELFTSWAQTLFNKLPSHTILEQKLATLEDHQSIEGWQLVDPENNVENSSSNKFALTQHQFEFLKKYNSPNKKVGPILKLPLKLLLVPIHIDQNYLGVLGISLSFSRSASLKTITFIFLLGTLLLIFIFYLLFNHFILRPLDQLISICTRIQSGQYLLQETHPANNEIGLIIHTLHKLFSDNVSYQKELEGKYAIATQKIKKTEQHLIITERLASTGKLVAGIAHEINNPLGGMMNAVSRLKKKETLQHQVEYFELLQEGLIRIKEIVDQILHFSPRKKDPREVVLKEVLNRAHQFVKHRIKNKQMEVNWQIDENLPLIFGDAQELQQVFQNLIINAVDASSSQSQLDIRAKKESATVLKIEVQDYGEGMEETEVSKAFDLFYTTKEVGKGTGIGLSVVLNIIENHGGTLTINSTKNQGTTLSIYLPIYKAKQENKENSKTEGPFETE